MEVSTLSQQANPGGILDSADIVGRDELAARLWKILERRSLYITAERRMGKTSIVRDKMGKEPPAGVRLIYMDVSRAGTPLEFVEKLLNESKTLFDAGKQAKFFMASIAKSLPNIEIKAGVAIKLPSDLGSNWKTLLESLLHYLSSLPDRVVLAFDEFPLMLLAMKRNAGSGKGESVVMELLDTLRAACQTNVNLRMIYTGSLGLHHVLTILKDQGYQNDPTNDMAVIDIKPLELSDAAELSRRLLRGEDVAVDDLDEPANHLAQVTDGMPYYIQHLVEELGAEELPGEIDEIDCLLAARLSGMRDPWHLRYYDERIDTHYAEADRRLARILLDQLAASESPRTFDDLVEGVDPAKSSRDPEQVRTVLRLLGMDHYLSRDDTGGYRFRYPFIKRVWQAIRQ